MMGMMAVRIELLGRVRLLANGAEVHCGHTPLMCVLALRSPQPLRRSDLIEILYRTVPRKEALNRLRVGLSRIRMVIPIEEEADTVRLIPGEVEIDLQTVRCIANFSDPTTEDDEFNVLRDLVEIVSKPLMPEIQDDWVEPERLTWSVEAIDILTRLAELADSRNDWGVQRQAAMAGLKHLPNDEQLWTHVLRASAHLGDASEAFLSWSRCRKQLQSEGDDFSTEIVELARSLRERSEPRAAQFGTDEEDVLLRLAERCVSEDPSALTSLLCSPSFVIESKRRPEAALRLLDAVLESGKANVFDDSGLRIVRVVTLGFLDRWKEAIADGEVLLKSMSKPHDRQRLLSSMCFGSFFAGELRKGAGYLDELLLICKDHGWEHEGWLAKCAHASCLWMLTEFESSNFLFGQCIEYLESVREIDVAAFLAVTRSNHASLLADMGNLNESLDLAQAADKQARMLGIADTSCRTAATLARVLWALGRSAEAAAEAKRAIRLAIRQSSVRLHVNTLENIGIGLSCGPDRVLGESMIQSGWAIRQAHALPTVALFQWRREKFGSAKVTPAPIHDSKSLLVDAYRRLEPV